MRALRAFLRLFEPIVGLAKGLLVTLRSMFEKPVTTQYP